MSRVGKQPIIIPPSVTVSVTPGLVSVKGPRGELKKELHREISVEVKNNQEVLVSIKSEVKRTLALWGLFRTLIANMISGVTSGFEKKLEFEGVGFRAVVEGDSLVMQLGFSHPIKFKAPAGIKLSVEKNTIIVSGFDKELVGEVAARLRHLKPVEPYKGKGIKYKGELVRRKAGKKAVASA